MNTFHNPYHFVPVKKGGRTDDLDAADLRSEASHVTHDRYAAGTRSGRIVCRLTTQTPVFVGSERTREASAEAASEVSHFELGGRPAFPATSLRGLYSGVAEAASNSALRVLDDAGYSYRRLVDPGQPEASRPLSAIGMVLVEQDGEGGVSYRLRPLTLPLMDFKKGNTATLEPHWRRLYQEPALKVYVGDESSIKDPRFPYRTFSREHERYYGLKLRRRSWGTGAAGVLVRDDDMYVKADRFLLAQLPQEDAKAGRRRPRPMPWEEIPEAERGEYTRGIMRVLGRGDDRPDIPNTKKHELFIPYPEGAESLPSFPIQAGAVERFHDLADQRTEASEGGESPLPYEPRGTRRNSDPGRDGRKFRLKDGDLVWFRPATNAAEIAEVSLSSVWRGRVESSDGTAASTHTFFEKVDPELLPFNPARKQVTIAEQLFGFVEASKDQSAAAARALSGRVYFSHALHHDPGTAGGPGDQEASPYLGPVTLKILDGPKPPCPALYFKRASGNPGHVAKRDLRPGAHHPQGRKFYLHHRDKEVRQQGNEPWRSHNTDPQDPKSRLRQKVRISPVRSGVVFYFHVDFDNLSPRELGLLLYALKPAEGFRHKLGMGKPIGLGSVNTEVLGLFLVDRERRYGPDALFKPRYTEAWVAAGEDQGLWPHPYDDLKAGAPSAAGAGELRDAFAAAMDQEIRAALEVLGDPHALRAAVHTPLVEHGDPEDETFKWFVENDRKAAGKEQGVKPAYLSPLPDSSGHLPMLPAHKEE